MSKTKRIMITKRDGQLEPFDVAKPRRCLTAAMRDSSHDEHFADVLARAVEFHLFAWPKTSLPTTDYVSRCLQTALTQTGMEEVAEQLIRHHRLRTTRRRNLSVLDSRSSRLNLTRWRKGAVARTLERRYGLSHSVARILAGEIEQRVLALSYTVVSTALIAEVLRNELLAWGLADGTTDTAPAVPASDVVADGQPEKEC